MRTVAPWKLRLEGVRTSGMAIKVGLLKMYIFFKASVFLVCHILLTQIPLEPLLLKWLTHSV